MESEKKHHIKVLENLLKEIKGKIELYSENKNIDLTKEKDIAETLGYAISSLKTDLKYDLMYEGEVIYTKADMVAMLEELKTEIEELQGKYSPYYDEASQHISEVIQQKIEQLKENKKH